MDAKHNSSAASGPAELVVELVRPQFWTSGLVFFFGVSGMILANLVAAVIELVVSGAPAEALGAPVSLTIVGMILVGVVAGRRILAHIRPLPPLSFFADHLTLPTDTGALKARRVDYGGGLDPLNSW